jgi:putative ABC transport system permease protein
MPAAFEFPVTAELWMPLVIAGDLGREREKRFLQVLGRLKPGVSPEQARSEMKGIAGRLARLYPGANMDWTVELALLRQRVVRDSGTRDPILILIVAAGCVWLLGCANVANLQLASATRRLKELAIRAALGANPRRLVGQLLVESLVTGMIAGLVSLLFALACIHGIKVSLPTDIARYLSGWKTVGLDARVLVFALAAAALTGILCGIAPALLIWRSEPFAILKESARGSTLGRGHDWLRGSLVVAEVTLSLVLLICAGLVIEGFQTVLHRWRGFVSDKVLTFRITLPAAQYPTPSQVTSFFDRALEEMATLPGVNSAAFGSHLPFAHKAWPQRPLHIEGKPAPNGKDFQVAFQTVSPGYFRTLKIPLRAGRTFRAGDQAGAARVAVISESLARRYWPDEPVLGRRIQLPADAGDESPYFTIVGVVGNVRRQASEPDDQAVYCSFAQEPERTMLCALQTQVNPKSMIGSVRARMRQLDALQPITNLKTLDQIIAESMVALRVPAEMLTFLGLLTLLLAGAGIYSVLAYAVRQRTHEIGIRLALGAPRAEVLRMVIVAALKLAAIGISAGLPIAFGCGRVLSSVLFGTGSLRLGAVVCAVILLTATALLAALLPARQAISVDPVMALRKE